MTIQEDDIETRLKAHSAYFTSMVELIPAKFYIIKEEAGEGRTEDDTDSKFWINKRSRAPKQEVKEATKKAKRLKLDPSDCKLSEGCGHERVYENGVSDDTRHSEDVAEGQQEGTSEGCSDDEHVEAISKRHPKAAFSVERIQSGDLNDLRDRLHTKIDELRGKRQSRTHQEGKERGTSSKRERQKHEQMMEKRRHKKETRKKDKERKHLVKQHPIEKQGENSVKRPSIKDESGRIVFSKFDFGATVAYSDPKGKSKDYKKLLAKAEAAQKKLEKLKETDEKKSKELQEKLQWQRAMEMAKGTKLKDDAKRLKKTVKRLDSKKAKSRKQWEERQKQEMLAKEKRQEKRKKNIQERIEQAKAKKMKKRGKPRKPGF